MVFGDEKNDLKQELIRGRREGIKVKKGNVLIRTHYFFGWLCIASLVAQEFSLKPSLLPQ